MKVIISEEKDNITEESKIKYLKFYLAVPHSNDSRETALFVRVYSPDDKTFTPDEKCVLFTTLGKIYHSDVKSMLAYYTIYEVNNDKITLTLGQ